MSRQTEIRRRYLTGSVAVDDLADRRRAHSRGAAGSSTETLTAPNPDELGRAPKRARDLRLRVLEAVMFRAPTRRNELAELLDASPAILGKELAALTAAGIVSQSVEDPDQRPLGARGRPPVFVSMIAGAAHAVGVEIGTRALRVIVCDLAGTIHASRTVPWFPVDPQMTLDRVEELVARGLRETGVEFDDLVGVGVSSAQTIAPDRVAAGAFAGWGDIDTAAELERRLAVPTTVERAAIAGAVAEHRFGAGRRMADVMYVRLSTGSGLGFIIEGEPYRGASGLAGEVGHVALTAGTRACYCGRHGCLETVASPEAVAVLFGEVYGQAITVPRMIELVRSGDRRARQLISDAGSLIGESLAPAVSLFNPEVCIIGGELSLVGETLVASIRREIARTATPASTSEVHIVRSQRGREAEVLGAAIMQLARAPEFLASRTVSAAGDPADWNPED